MEIIFARWRTLFPARRVPTIGSLLIPHLSSFFTQFRVPHGSPTRPPTLQQHSSNQAWETIGQMCMCALFLVHTASLRWLNTISSMDDGPIKATATGKKLSCHKV